MTGLLAVIAFVVVLLAALFAVGLVIGPARSDRWARKVFGPAPRDEGEPIYSDPGKYHRPMW